MSDPASEPADADTPFLTVVSGEPTAEELAALVAVLAARRSDRAGESTAAPRSAWRDRSRLVRQMPLPGPGSWRASSLP